MSYVNDRETNETVEAFLFALTLEGEYWIAEDYNIPEMED